MQTRGCRTVQAPVSPERFPANGASGPTEWLRSAAACDAGRSPPAGPHAAAPSAPTAMDPLGPGRQPEPPDSRRPDQLGWTPQRDPTTEPQPAPHPSAHPPPHPSRCPLAHPLASGAPVMGRAVPVGAPPLGGPAVGPQKRKLLPVGPTRKRVKWEPQTVAGRMDPSGEPFHDGSPSPARPLPGAANPCFGSSRWEEVAAGSAGSSGVNPLDDEDTLLWGVSPNKARTLSPRMLATGGWAQAGSLGGFDGVREGFKPRGDSAVLCSELPQGSPGEGTSDGDLEFEMGSYGLAEEPLAGQFGDLGGQEGAYGGVRGVEARVGQELGGGPRGGQAAAAQRWAPASYLQVGGCRYLCGCECVHVIVCLWGERGESLI